MDRLESKISRLEREIKDKHGENEKLTRDVRVLDQTSKKAIDSLSARVKILTEENRKLLVLEKTGNNDKEKTAGDLGSKEAEIAFLKNTVRQTFLTPCAIRFVLNARNACIYWRLWSA